MRRILAAAAGAAILAGLIALTTKATAQSGSSNCPAGFKLVTTSSDDPLDVNLDRLVCEQLDVRSDTLVYSMRVDNSGFPCPAGPSGGFLEPNSPFMLVPNPIGSPPDRNCNAAACLKLFTTRTDLHAVAIDDKGPSGMCP